MTSNIDINDVKLIKLKSGEEIHGLVKSNGNTYIITDPVELDYDETGNAVVNKWCWLSESRVFRIDMHDTLFTATTVLPDVAEQYILFLESEGYDNNDLELSKTTLNEIH